MSANAVHRVLMRSQDARFEAIKMALEDDSALFLLDVLLFNSDGSTRRLRNTMFQDEVVGILKETAEKMQRFAA